MNGCILSFLKVLVILRAPNKKPFEKAISYCPSCFEVRPGQWLPIRIRAINKSYFSSRFRCFACQKISIKNNYEACNR